MPSVEKLFGLVPEEMKERKGKKEHVYLDGLLYTANTKRSLTYTFEGELQYVVRFNEV